mmetsp:Transcript_48892/g.144501  ORF Transcript_48892/g.144501 Transcript_48892/m.144501 type:complete len:205 (+) Transcript_48892:24-638(+)|eukprot:2062904-Prymnesium_polylepis.1
MASHSASADDHVTLVIHRPDATPFDEAISTEATVADLIERIRRRLGTESGARVRLICAGAVLQESNTVGKAVRATPGGARVFHLHCAVTAVHSQPPPPPPPREEVVDELGALLPGHSLHGVPMFDEGGEVLPPRPSRQADFVWGFSLGLVLGVLTLFILTDRAMPRTMQSGILFGVSCNLLFGYHGGLNDVHEAHPARDDPDGV